MWTASQRATLSVIVLGLSAALMVRYANRRWFLTDPPPAQGPRQAELADRLDPNTATASALAALPNLGPTRAATIVAYREQFIRDGRGTVPFQRLEDLLKIKGVGVATIENLKGYLVFEENISPSTMPR